jgi:hypothetical protein
MPVSIVYRYRGGGHWDLRYGCISLFFLRYFCIFLENLQYYDIGNLAVHSICNFGLKKTAVIESIKFLEIRIYPDYHIVRILIHELIHGTVKIFFGIMQSKL